MLDVNASDTLFLLSVTLTVYRSMHNAEFSENSVFHQTCLDILPKLYVQVLTIMMIAKICSTRDNYLNA